MSEKTLPAWMRRTHPLVRHSLHRSSAGELRYVIFGSAIGLFLLFGGLSLPLLYLFIWLAILVQQAVTMAGRLHEAQAKRTWELLRATPYSPRELLLSTWAAGYWQLRQSWVMGVYRLLQGIAVIGLMVFGLWLAEFPAEQSVLVLAAGLAAILLQPPAEAYFGGMVGLLCAGMLPRQIAAMALALVVVVAYWGICLGIVIGTVFSDSDTLSLAQILTALSVPSVAPLVLGYAALRSAEARLRSHS